MWLLLARSSWLRSRAGTVQRPSGSCHLEKDSFSPCLPHKLHQAPLPTVLTPRTCLPAPPGVEGTGCHQPALHWRVHAWLAACPGDKDLRRRGKPCVEFFSLEKAGGGKGLGFFAQLDLRRNALWEGSSVQTRNAASFQYSAALRVLQLGRAAEGQRPLQGGALLSPCPWLWPSTTGFSLRRVWAGRGSQEGWFSCRVMKALAVWRL